MITKTIIDKPMESIKKNTGLTIKITSNLKNNVII